MDTAELARLKALADAATPGPWKRSTKSWDGDDIHTIVVNVGNGDEAEVLQEPTDFSCYPSGSFVTTSGTVANLDFAAAARTAVPALIAEVERLKEKIRRMEVDLEDEACRAQESEEGEL